MTQTDGERELVLGNKQLISLFFVVIALCGVFFAMGYMMGRNTTKSGAANLEANAAPASQGASTPSAPAPQPQDGESPPETTDQATDGQSTAPADSAPITPAAAPTPAPAPNPAVPAPAVHTQPAQDAPVTPAAGSIWLQVTALRRADADNLLKTLREQNFPVILANSSKPDLFRVLVGPYHQMSDVADAKARLKALGFANAFVQK